ncbi:ACP S-malonyltransferase [Suttonella sp. R2A3]|uniref:ACP S-malonyltransferase n=1 Tax=Suttonella sp. R2A3 TaxID=2908648 RepID=UPI001F3BDC35|nr:ACP S-malonyltransferase [Suttonella sp. R2A3]UJF24091.1 ACP S-malonyltransferase [Suttonella sp. R2A3]
MSSAIIFPGQGSQSQGMLAEMAGSFPQIKERFAEASEVVKQDLWDIAQTNPKGLLNATAITQPILLAAGIASYDILKAETDIKPAYFAGHSLGEYTALCAAGSLTFAEAIDLVHHRGELMQDAVPYGSGAMAAILGLDDEEVVEICAGIRESVQAANFNAPGQVVIAGKTVGVEKAVAEAKARGAKRAIVLPVSVPSHCTLMRSPASKLSLYLDHTHWKMPSIPVIHNVDAQPRHNIDGIKSALGAQLYKPVRWVACVEALVEQGVGLCVEAAPGKVLSGLNKRINSKLTTLALDSKDGLSAINEALERE